MTALTTLAANIFNANRYYPYEAFFVVGGYINFPELFAVDPIGGFGEQKKFTSIGSGSPFAMGVLDTKYKEKMTKEEAINLVCEAIRASKKRDINTGGEKIDLYIVDKKGIENIKKDWLAQFLFCKNKLCEDFLIAERWIIESNIKFSS